MAEILLSATPELLPGRPVDGSGGMAPPPPAPADSTPAGNPAGSGQPTRPTLRREWLLLAISILLLVAIVAPPLVNLGRYQHRIVAAMSRSLGRDVTLRSVTLRLLPTPALVMTDVVVSEEPGPSGETGAGAGFGAEPSLRAPSVIAQLRLTSLWRGRLEVSRVELSDASLNLVRNQAGRWNVGSILLQASHVANAPTAQRRAGPAPRFPYIEITDSRINVKQGAEKLPYSLLNANLSMWLAEPELWQIRLDGQPVRTDIALGLSDTGTLKMEGSLHRATALGRMPLALHGDWSSAPLGQVSRLLLGRDPGWRGDLHAMADVAGDLDHLAIHTHVLIANLHREEFTPAEAFSVDATCHGTYSRAARMLSDLGCRWPVGEGQLLLSGHLAAVGLYSQLPGDSALALTVQRLPASFLLAAAGLARSDFAPIFRLEGALNGMLSYNAHSGTAAVFGGGLESSQLLVEAPGLDQPLELHEARLAPATPSPSGVATLMLTAAPVDLGGAAPVELNAQLTPQGFLLHASGSATLARLEALGRATQLLPPAIAWLGPQGSAQFDVTRSAGWPESAASAPLAIEPAARPAPPPGSRRPGTKPGARFGAPRESDPAAASIVAVTSGWLQLRNARYAPRFLAEPVLLPFAEAVFVPGGIAWNVPAAIFDQVPLELTATYPFHCAGAPGCTARVRASCATLDGSALVAALLGRGRAADNHLFDQLLSRFNGDRTPWPALDGSFHADALTLGRLSLRNANASISIAGGQATLKGIDAQALGGTLHGEGSMTLAGGVPHYVLTSVVTRASASAAAAVFHENWGAGTISASSQLQLSGADAAELAASATGTFHAEWAHGGVGAQTPLARFALWAGNGRVADQALTLSSGQIRSGSAARMVPLTGTIGFDRTLSLQAGQTVGEPSEQRLTITGTLARPVLASR